MLLLFFVKIPVRSVFGGIIVGKFFPCDSAKERIQYRPITAACTAKMPATCGYKDIGMGFRLFVIKVCKRPKPHNVIVFTIRVHRGAA